MKETPYLSDRIGSAALASPSVMRFGIVRTVVAGAPSWPQGIASRGWRRAVIIWASTVFSEFIGPFNVLHQPLNVRVVAWALWAVPALLAEGMTIAYVLDRARATPTRPEQRSS
jgi:hypothetical protein